MVACTMWKPAVYPVIMTDDREALQFDYCQWDFPAEVI